VGRFPGLASAGDFSLAWRFMIYLSREFTFKLFAKVKHKKGGH
jgi:hypothetical protein